jgi:hypothetical protein
MVKKSFLGISNAIDGAENSFICCAKELPNLHLQFVNESSDDPFQISDDEADYDSD